MEHITLALAVITVILGIVILSKVNKLITMLHTPIVKRVSDTNLKPNRHTVSAQDMAARNNDRRDNNRNNDRRDRNNSNNNGNRQERNNNRDRNNDRIDRNDRRSESAAEKVAEADAPVVEAPAAPVAPAPVAPAPVAAAPAPVAAPVVETPVAEAPRTEGRRPLPPRVQATLPETPAAVPSAPAASAAEPESVGAEFDPTKVRYGRRNVMKKLPVEEDSAEEAKA